ncbi:MAG: GGDEF domain-containing protein [Arcobacter sp.]|nr:GGDEF domain-containing protein [Arcobacter sp.]
MKNKLKEVTYLTVKGLKKQEVILPGTYSDEFEKIAKEFEVDFDKENVILKDLNQELDHVDNIVKKTNDNLTHLHENTEKAQKAIESNDSEALKAINNELSTMKDQIAFLQKELFSDPLTGAYNRKWFADYYLDQDTFKADGHMAFLDLNKFKFINDNYGHLIGDQVLKYLVKFLKKELDFPGIDVVRYAGDEFLVLFDKEQTSNMNIDQTMKDVQLKLTKQKLKSKKIDELKFSFSYGIASFKEKENMEHTLELVDELMYKNKESNR